MSRLKFGLGGLSAQAAETKGEAEEHAGDQPDAAGQQFLRVHQDRRKC